MNNSERRKGERRKTTAKVIGGLGQFYHPGTHQMEMNHRRLDKNRRAPAPVAQAEGNVLGRLCAAVRKLSIADDAQRRGYKTAQVWAPNPPPEWAEVNDALVAAERSLARWVKL